MLLLSLAPALLPLALLLHYTRFLVMRTTDKEDLAAGLGERFSQRRMRRDGSNV